MGIYFHILHIRECYGPFYSMFGENGFVLFIVSFLIINGFNG